jgi:hypothetical protein
MAEFVPRKCSPPLLGSCPKSESLSYIDEGWASNANVYKFYHETDIQKIIGLMDSLSKPEYHANGRGGVAYGQPNERGDTFIDAYSRTGSMCRALFAATDESVIVKLFRDVVCAKTETTRSWG